ncbi:hypothetical protein [Polluticoccus soli]|uniref:hypothetical protein n=1 Tax=Polluticoccus soli TaxID=3034150 RepID=UPI0023E0E199|nr:hypothetical protein [Flavipsychrobacter sp. JY13-12]
MQIFDLSAKPDAAYKLAETISEVLISDITIYEFHQEVNPEGILNCENGHRLFREKTSNFYQRFVSFGLSSLDEFPAIIHIAVKIGDQWFLAEDCGSNYYMGYGPGGIYRLREAACKKGALLLHTDADFRKWVNGISPKKHLKEARKDKEENDFNRIIKQMMVFAYTAQDQRQTFRQMKEEQLRDYIIPIFTSRFKAYGEVKCGEGKTDIRIDVKNSDHSYIFELKIWKGVKTLQDAIDQLQRYISWHHHFGGIVVFYKENQFTQTYKTATEYLKANYQTIELDNSRKQELAVKCAYNSDSQKLITIHFIFICLS